MLKDILARIDQRLEFTGLSESGAAKNAGLSADAIRNIRRAVNKGEDRRGVSTNTIAALAPVLKTTTAWLLEGDTDSAARDLPIRGTAEGRHLRGGAFSVDEPLMGYTWRPPVLVGAAQAYAFYVGKTSMEPEFREGQLYVAMPGRPVKQGDAVVVVTRAADGTQANIGRLVSQDEAEIVIVKRQPERSTTRIPLAQVVSVDRVLDNNEIFGV